MPTTSTEHADKWRKLADNDYFILFVNAWIPHLSWKRILSGKFAVGDFFVSSPVLEKKDRWLEKVDH